MRAHCARAPSLPHLSAAHPSPLCPSATLTLPLRLRPSCPCDPLPRLCTCDATCTFVNADIATAQGQARRPSAGHVAAQRRQHHMEHVLSFRSLIEIQSTRLLRCGQVGRGIAVAAKLQLRPKARHGFSAHIAAAAVCADSCDPVSKGERPSREPRAPDSSLGARGPPRAAGEPRQTPIRRQSGQSVLAAKIRCCSSSRRRFRRPPPR